MKNRLIDLLKDFRTPICEGIDAKLPDVEGLANYLIDKGVIVPPCKVGDTIFGVVVKSNHIYSAQVVGFHLGKFPTLRGHKRNEYLVCYSGYCLRHIDIDKIGKTVFLTREEAEKALKGE